MTQQENNDVKMNIIFIIFSNLSCPGPVIAEDKILQVMPSVVLALHLLCERRAESSPWKPYLDIMPDTYTTPLYFTPDELKLLKGSPAQSRLHSPYCWR